MLGRNRPLDRHPIDGGLGLIPAVGDDGDAAAEDPAAGQRRVGNREPHGGPHARHVADGVEIEALDIAAVDRTGLHGSPLHARHADVDSVNGLPRHLERHVEVLLLRSHERPLVRRLDGDRLGVRMRRQRGAMRDVPVGDRSAASGVRDDAVFGR